VHPGLQDIDQPAWGGWSGRFSRVKVADYWSKHRDIRDDEQAASPFFVYREEADAWIDPETGDAYDNIYTPVWRWRRAFFNDYRCRMDWCVQPFDRANHNPVAALDGDTNDTILIRTPQPNTTLQLSARASTDPDGDPLRIRWYLYPEAGTYDQPITLENADTPEVSLRLPADTAGKQIHLILEVRDENPIASLYDYRRLVLNVSPATP